MFRIGFAVSRYEASREVLTSKMRVNCPGLDIAGGLTVRFTLGRRYTDNHSLSAPVHKYGHVFRDVVWFLMASQPVSSAPFCVIRPFLCHSSPSLSFAPFCVIRPFLCHSPPSVSFAPFCVIRPLLCHSPPSVSFVPFSVIRPLLCHSPPSVSFVPFCVIRPLLCHSRLSVSFAPFCVIRPLLCHSPLSVSFVPFSVILSEAKNLRFGNRLRPWGRFFAALRMTTCTWHCRCERWCEYVTVFTNTCTKRGCL